MLEVWSFAMLTSQTSRKPPCRSPRVCLACHGDRLASLLETASSFRIYRLTTESSIEEGMWFMPPEGFEGIAVLLAKSGVDLLVCGGATCCCLNHFSRHGMTVIPWVTGNIITVLAALRQNRIEELLAPGASRIKYNMRKYGICIYKNRNKSS